MEHIGYNLKSDLRIRLFTCSTVSSTAARRAEEGADGARLEAFERHQHRPDGASAAASDQDGHPEDGQLYHDPRRNRGRCVRC